jgi:hypothetical protein
VLRASTSVRPRDPSLQALQDQSIYFAVVRTAAPTKAVIKLLVNGFADRCGTDAAAKPRQRASMRDVRRHDARQR